MNQKVNVNDVKTKTCKECGITYYTSSDEETVCLGCKISIEMKLPPDTIVNRNVMNIYSNGNYDKVKGVDKTYLTIAEGVKLLTRKRKETQLCSKISMLTSKTNEEIEPFVKGVETTRNAYFRGKYDALVFVKINANSSFLIFGISYSDRLVKILLDKDVLFKKNFAISLAINWYWKENNKKK